VSKASNKADDSDSDELHVDLWLFECRNWIKECGNWKKGKECVALKKEIECVCVRLVSACLFGRKVKQSLFPKMICCEVGNCASEHILEAWLTADRFVHLDNNINLE
jgi:hypothetical protein